MESKLLKKKKLLLTKGNKIQLAWVCNDLAELYMREGKYDLSKHEYKNAAKLYKELDKPIFYARANRMIGEICTTLAEFDDALRYEQIHWDVAKEQNNELEIQRALASIGRTYLTKAISDPEKLNSDSLQLAHNSFLESLSACESLKDITNSERMDMRARLYLNIGVVKEHQGDFEGGENYMTKSILICKSHEIYDQLHHGYYTLGLLHTKNEVYKKALTNFNYALDVADRLSDKIPPLCASYVAKADVLIKIGEFTSAKHVLFRAYKLRSPNIEEGRSIEHSLKVVAALCKAEDTLITLAVNDFKKRKELYERMGDGLADLKMFAKAIEYYLKMLECAIACGETGNDLLPVYVSLAQTYKDNKQYKLAYEYFQKEYEISRKNPEESYKTLLNLAVVLELVKNPYENIAGLYNKARKEAYATKNKQYEGKVISYFIRYQKKMGKLSEAEELQKELDMLGYETSDSESDGENEGGTPDIGNDINIDELTDVSNGGSDKEDLNQSRQTRKRGRQIAVKKNQKGESVLHTACIRGNEDLVLSLLDQKHPVNIRDYSGWMPLHEACNHGHLEVVRILIKHGASINDRGGKNCEGITPLHDACICGHFEIAELLLDNSASPISFDDKGRTPLDCLKTWRKENLSEPINETAYENLIARLTTALEKAGKPINQNIPDETSNAFYEEKPANSPTRSTRGSPRNTTPRKSPRVSPKKSPYGPVGTLRHSVDIEDDLNQPSCSSLRRHSSVGDKSPTTKINSIKHNLSFTNNNSSEFDTSAYEYKRAIEALRNRVPESKPSPRKSKKSSAAFMSDEEVGDNWLEDDLKLNPNKKQRASNVKQNFIESTGIRKISGQSFSPRTRQSVGESQSEEENNEPYTNRNSGYESGDSVHSTCSNKRKRSQTSLLESGFSRNRSDSPLNTCNYNTSPVTGVDNISSKSYKRQQKLNSFVNRNDDSQPDSTTQQTILSQNSYQSTVRPLLAVNVRIDNRLWRVPVPASEVNQLTIEWLAKESAKRYYKQEGIFPSLQLLTKEGAILINEDPLSMVFISETKAEEVQSNIVSWNLPPLPERYVEACCSVKIDPCSKVRKCLDECQGTLNLKLASISINKNQLPPLFRAINRQNNLQQLDLSENTLLNEGVQQLCYALPSLIQLRSLNISKNNITGEGIRFLSEVFTKSEQPILENLTELNFSFNLFGDDTIRHLAVILQKIKLRVLNLCGCSLPEKIFQNVFNHGIILNLEHLEFFDLSYNDLNSEDIIKFISFLNIGNITNLNVSHNSTVSTSGIVKAVAANLNQYETNKVKILNFAKCKVNDSEIWDLLRTLTKCQELDTLNLSFNTDLTAVSLRRLIQHRPTFSFINLLGCTNIVQYFDQFSFTSDCTSGMYHINNLKLMKISINYEKHPKETDYLISMWEREWGKQAKIKKLYGRAIHFSVED